jgi:hypothetical protein
MAKNSLISWGKQAKSIHMSRGDGKNGQEPTTDVNEK